MNNDKRLTPKQIENWRQFITMEYGVTAKYLTVEQIQEYKDNLQTKVNKACEDLG